MPSSNAARSPSAQELHPTALWEGHLPLAGEDGKALRYACWGKRGRVLRIGFSIPREISALRLVLDTGNGCYSQIDAMGLVAAGG